MAVTATREEKLKFLRRNKKTAESVFEGFPNTKTEKKFVEKIRDTFGYSINTTDREILKSWGNLYDSEY